MKSKIIGLSFLLLAVILLGLWFQITHKTRQLEKQITLVKSNISLENEKNQVLLLEYAAHTNPIYIKKLTSIYLNYEKINDSKPVVFTKKNFIKEINKINMKVEVSTNN